MSYPKPILDEIDGITIVRDDLLEGGSKVRFLDNFIKNMNESEIVFGGGSANGYSQISLAHVCKKHNKKCVLFMAKRAKPTINQQKSIDAGADMRWVPNGMLTVTKCRAREYAEESDDRYNLPFNYDSVSEVKKEMLKIMRGVGKRVTPTEIWSVGASGTTSRALQEAFPDIPINVVQIGHVLSNEEIGRAKLYVSKLKYTQTPKEEDMPPFNSNSTYDSKAWVFIKQYAKKGALFWNVAGE